MFKPIVSFVSDFIAALSQAEAMRRNRADLVEGLARDRAFPWPRVEGMPLDHRRQIAALLDRLGYGLPAAQLDPGKHPAFLGGIPEAPPSYAEGPGEASELENAREWFVNQLPRARPLLEKYLRALEQAEKAGAFVAVEDLANGAVPAAPADFPGSQDLSLCVPKHRVSGKIWASLEGRSHMGENSAIVRQKDFSPQEWAEIYLAIQSPLKTPKAPAQTHDMEDGFSPPKVGDFSKAPTQGDLACSAMNVSPRMVSVETWERLSKIFQLDATGMIMVLRDQISPSEWTALGLEVEAWSKVG